MAREGRQNPAEPNRAPERASFFGLQVLLTVTRGGIFATALGLMAFEMFGKRHGLSLRIMAPALLLLGLIAAIMIYEPLQERIFATHYRDVSAKPGLSAAQRLETSFERSGRGLLWRYVFDKVGRDYHLFTGYGLGRAEVDVLKDVGSVPHNEYLRVLYEMGLVGLVVFVASLWQLWRVARAGVRRAENHLQQTVAGIGVAVITVYATGAMVDNMLNKYKSMGLFLYMFTAFILLLDVRPEKPAPAGWLRYRLPRRYQRHYSRPLCIGQKQLWFLLRFLADDSAFNLDMTEEPEFSDFRWVDFWYPAENVVTFKRRVYRQALSLLEGLVDKSPGPSVVQVSGLPAACGRWCLLRRMLRS